MHWKPAGFAETCFVRTRRSARTDSVRRLSRWRFTSRPLTQTESQRQPPAPSQESHPTLHATKIFHVEQPQRSWLYLRCPLLDRRREAPNRRDIQVKCARISRLQGILLDSMSRFAELLVV